MTSASSPTPLRIYQSTIGKKLLTGITGLGLALFVLVHMVGNLTLFFSAAAYNQFGHIVETLGPLTWSIELLLLGFVLLHAVLGVQIFIGKLKARDSQYATYQSTNQASPPSSNQPSDLAAQSSSYQSLSSRSMIWTGLLMAAFLIWHLTTFKFGPRYLIPNTNVRDLARLVFEKFHQPSYTSGYALIMVLVGVHLRHGLWSALQSLGLLDKRVRPWVYTLGTGLAVLTALGFLGLPVAIYAGWLGGHSSAF
ncbi:MAG: succinate dehydrogenase cytochrome b subunit [Cyanobacteria bacterium J06632_22]